MRLCLTLSALLLYIPLLSADTITPLPKRVDGSPQKGYILGPNDKLRIVAIHADEIPPDPVRIDPDGYINVPLVGRVHAAGLSVDGLQLVLKARLKDHVLDPQVSVNLVEFRNHPVSVIGAVKTPGVHQIQEPKRLLEVLSLAGGLRNDAGTKVRITRPLSMGDIPLENTKVDPSGEFTVAVIDLDSLLRSAEPANNIYIQPNDVISVPEADLIYIIGEVKKPGGFPLHEREYVHVLKAIAMAEGMLPTAGSKHAKIMRAKPGGGNLEEIPVNVKEILRAQNPDVPMLPGDILVIPNNVPRSVALRSVEAALQITTGLIIWRR